MSRLPAALALVIVTIAAPAAAQVYVPGHLQSDGIYIRPHFSPEPARPPAQRLEASTLDDLGAAADAKAKALRFRPPSSPTKRPDPGSAGTAQL